MPQVGAREGAARVAAARGVEGRRVAREAGLLEHEGAVGGERLAVSRVPCRQHTVEEVDAAGDRLHQIGRLADAHQIAGLLARQQARRQLGELEHHGLGLPHRHAADRVAVEPDGDGLLDRAAAQVGVGAALDDAEQRLAAGAALPVRRLRAAGPAERQRERLLGRRGRRGVRQALVQRMDDVRAEGLLDLDHELRAQEMLRAVDRRSEPDALVGDPPELGETPHLEATGVGEDRPRPGHEPVQPAERLHQLLARPQEEVVGVGQDDLGPRLREVRRREALHGAAGADGHEGRGVDAAVHGLEPASTRGAVRPEQGELHAPPCSTQRRPAARRPSASSRATPAPVTRSAWRRRRSRSGSPRQSRGGTRRGSARGRRRPPRARAATTAAGGSSSGARRPRRTGARA